VKVTGLSVPDRAFCEELLTPVSAGATLLTLTLLDSTLLSLSPSLTWTLMSTGVGEIGPSSSLHLNLPLVAVIRRLPATSLPAPPQSTEAEKVLLSTSAISKV
jgi:hypothetical protein